MARLRIFPLVIGLCFAPTIAALAITPQQTLVSKSSSAQSSMQAPVIPSATKSKMTAKDSSDPVGQPAAPQAQAEPKKRRYIAEEMMMQRAWMYSAVMPGWGQVYNGDYWKMPAFYAVFVALGWGAVYNHQEYIQSRRALRQRKGSHSFKNYVDNCRRDRDLCVIFATLWYVANIFDAYVGASLKTFNLSDDISLEVQPSMLPTAQSTPTVGLSLTLSFEP